MESTTASSAFSSVISCINSASLQREPRARTIRGNLLSAREQFGMYAPATMTISLSTRSQAFWVVAHLIYKRPRVAVPDKTGCQKPGVPRRTLAETRRGKVCLTRGDHVEYLGQAESDFDAQGQIVLSGELSDQRIIETRGPITSK
ncbi:MAG: hypothetical protein CM15mP74_03970 [Halieaceae bacterium]|nr:MAG: hypothetical protein CM15mP74_03970 [Halieaceae bacterium]